MGPSWKIGSALGIGLYLHWTFLLVPLWAFGLVAREFGVQSGIYGAVLVVTMFGCVLLHELGHAYAARRFGIGTRDITLYPIGGVARLEDIPERPLQEFVIALAGPAVNVVLAAICIPLGFLLGVGGGDPMHYSGPGRFLIEVGILNIFPLTLFNLIPAFPMDGGRVLRAILQVPLGRLLATEIAANIGLALAGVFFIGGLYMAIGPGMLQGYMFMILAVFVMMMGQHELRFTRRRAERRLQDALAVLPADADAIDLGAFPLRPNYSGFTWSDRQRLWVEWREGRPVHIIQSE